MRFTSIFIHILFSIPVPHDRQIPVNQVFFISRNCLAHTLQKGSKVRVIKKKTRSVIIKPATVRGCRGIPSLQGGGVKWDSCFLSVWDDTGYIKTQPPSMSFTSCIMEKHQAEQEEKLVEVKMDTCAHQPRGSHEDRRGCFNRCLAALVSVMGLVIVALCIVFFYFMSCKQVSR